MSLDKMDIAFNMKYDNIDTQISLWIWVKSDKRLIGSHGQEVSNVHYFTSRVEIWLK